MTQYNGNISNLLQGVSQQPRRDRRPEQLGKQVNCYSSITEGLGKRPGTALGASGLSVTDFATAAKHTYDRGDGTERYTIICKDDAYVVVDLLAGVTRGVSGAATYLQDFTAGGLNPIDYLKFYTIADTTLVVNTTATPAIGSPATVDDWQAIIHCVKANYGYTYSITIDGSVVSTYTTPNTVTVSTTSADKASYLKTSDIIQELWDNGLSAWVTLKSVTAVKGENEIILTQATSAGHKFEVSDDNNNNDLKVMGFSSTNYDDLPVKCTPDYKIKITGVDTETDNDYYVCFERDEGELGIGRGHWTECVGFNVNQSLTASTMPHKIIRGGTVSTPTFTLSPITWVDRKAGDDNTNPDPSFIGRAIEDIVFYQERLVFLSEENAIASVTYDHFNLFADSVIQESDLDPIDTASSDNQVTNLKYALVFNASLMIFSDKAQFIHPEDAKFTSNTFSLASKSRFSVDLNTTPVASAGSVFFPYAFGEYVGIREYGVENITGNTRAEPITHHVEEYIPGRCLQIASTTDYNLLLVRADGDADSVYVYEWFDQGNERKQAAWHRWNFQFDILHIDVIKDILYLWYEWDTDEVAYLELDLSNQASDEIAFPLRLDNHQLIQSTDQTTTWRIPITLAELQTDSWDNVEVVGALNSGIEGARTTWTQDGTYIYVKQSAVPNATDPKFYVGVRYLSEAEITNPYVRASDGTPKTHGRMTLKTMKFNCSETGYLEVQVAKDYAPTFSIYYSSQILNSAYLLNSQAPLLDAEVKVPIRSKDTFCTITIKSESHLPFFVSDVDWSGDYNETGRRTI